MATNKQDVEKSELRKKIEKLRDENKEYETRVTALRQEKQAAQDVKEENYLDAEILSIEERISANNRQIDSINLQILELMKNQGKITAPPICYIFRQIIYWLSLYAWLVTTGEDSGLENLFITVGLSLVWALVTTFASWHLGWPVGWTQTAINLCDGLFLFLHLVGSHAIVQFLTGGIRWGGTEVLDPDQRPLVDSQANNYGSHWKYYLILIVFDINCARGRAGGSLHTSLILFFSIILCTVCYIVPTVVFWDLRPYSYRIFPTCSFYNCSN